ncbi:FecCD family ABC transporter permease [Desertibacillus haloalkaliphilus]|uniref:FecCD family ABC transporter permease n=1 Tax=Desertibacillus haloalkaliphilus TaxID=1328930 RepID=UPI001C25F333|nr:iron ABC transporter permease [Desertibacillus haloalkaliphilus]MBU8908914.1 iron ABC transporter permease [Desertibacillus haloalkaliphilus]
MNLKKYFVLRLGKDNLSFLVDRRSIFVFFILLLTTIIVALLSAGLGEMKINPINVIKAWFGYGTDMENLVVNSFRLPRIVIAILVGISFAISGAILQGIIRNPLASPDIIGITGGAAVAVVSFLAIFSNEHNALTVSIKWMPLAAFIGATLIALLIYILAWKNGVSPIRLVLIGIGLSALTQALTTLFMVLGPIYQASQANIWLTGSIYGASWENVATLLPWTVALLVILAIVTRHLNVQELGDSIATGVGSVVGRYRIGLLLLSTGFAAGAVAFAGGIGFVGLIAPHISRKLVGSSFGALLPVSALVGAILVMVADLIGRAFFSPNEIPAGVFTAVIGAPYFIYLLYKNRNL